MREKLIELLDEAWWNYRHGKGPAGMPINFAEHLIANGVTIQRWIPVAERLPEQDVRVLVWVGENSCNFPVIDTDRIHNGRWVRWDEYITHWMPLPEPPKGE